MTDAPAIPATAPEAAARLNTLSADATWSQKLFAGDGPTRQEFDALTQLVANADTTAEAIAGKSSPEMFETTTEGKLSTRDLARGVGTLRDAGLDDAVVAQVLRGDPVTKAERDEINRLQAKRMADQDWTKRLLAGDYDAKRELTLMSAVLAASIKEATA